MPPANTSPWLRGRLNCRIATAASTCISFLLLSVSLQSLCWLEVNVPETNMSSTAMVNKLCNKGVCSQLDGSSDFMKPSKMFLIPATIAGFIAAFSLFIPCQCLCCRGVSSNMLVSSAASFTTGAIGFLTMVLYTLEIPREEMSLVGRLHFTWRFWLAWVVFALYILNGFFSLISHLLSTASGSEQHTVPTLLEREMQRFASGDHTAVKLTLLPGRETDTIPVGNLFPDPSICLNATII